MLNKIKAWYFRYDRAMLKEATEGLFVVNDPSVTKRTLMKNSSGQLFWLDNEGGNRQQVLSGFSGMVSMAGDEPWGFILDLMQEEFTLSNQDILYTYFSGGRLYD